MAYQGTNGDDIIDAVKLGLTNIHIRGGKGNDIISPAGYAGGEGEEGNDTIIGTNQPGVSAYYGSAPSGIVANLATGKVQDGYGYQDTLVDIYNISGSRFNDQFVGSAGNDHFDGAGGSDSFVGGGGLDVVQYGSVKSTEVVLSYDVGTGITYVKKNVSGGDQGTDYLKGINSIRFSDGVTVTTVADTPYYTQKANAFPSFAQFYKWNGWTAGAAGGQALAVGQQDDLEHDPRVVRTGSDFIVLEPGIQGFEIEFVIDQVVQCEGESAGDNLLRQDHG